LFFLSTSSDRDVFSLSVGAKFQICLSGGPPPKCFVSPTDVLFWLSPPNCIPDRVCNLETPCRFSFPRIYIVFFFANGLLRVLIFFFFHGRCSHWFLRPAPLLVSPLMFFISACFASLSWRCLSPTFDPPLFFCNVTSFVFPPLA